MNNIVHNLNSTIEAFKNHCGFTKFKCDVSELDHAGFERKINIGLDYRPEIGRELKPSEIVDAICKPIFDDVKNSPLVKQLTEEKDAEIQRLNDEIILLLDKIKHLEPFQVYYKLHYNMTRGEAQK